MRKRTEVLRQVKELISSYYVPLSTPVLTRRRGNENEELLPICSTLETNAQTLFLVSYQVTGHP